MCCKFSSTDDHLQFITLSIHHCVQHDGIDAAHHAGSFPTAGTCYFTVGYMYEKEFLYAERTLFHTRYHSLNALHTEPSLLKLFEAVT